MNLFPNSESHLIGSNKWGRIALVLIFALALGGCSSNAAREAELATKEAERIAAEQEMARIVQEQERARTAELQRQREAEVADQVRLQAERERQAVEARAEEERRRQEEAEQQEQTRLAQLAVSEAVEVERREKLEQISQLEQQIAAIQTEADKNDAVFAIREGKRVQPENWELGKDDRLLRLWTMGDLQLAARLSDLSPPECLQVMPVGGGVLVMRVRKT